MKLVVEEVRKEVGECWKADVIPESIRKSGI
jgi:hypothetical protein